MASGEIYRLEAERVKEVFIACLFRDEAEAGFYELSRVTAEGITMVAGFHPERLSEHLDEIRSMLNELPEKFREGSGGGWSFLSACRDRHGRLWTGLHQRMEQLFLLGLATGMVRTVLPRDLWRSLPGGMPYYVIPSAEGGKQNGDG